MATINYATKEISCKIVYYGPAMSGKTTNLQYIHERAAAASKGSLIALATDADRTLFFDLLPLDAGSIHGFRMRFQIYTVPGQVYYNATRKLVLQGADGLVFVADSQWPKMRENLESLRNLEANLKEQGRSLSHIPYVLQYNKQDLEGLASTHYLEYLLNRARVPSFEASAVKGRNVLKTLEAICRLALHRLGQAR